MTTQASLRRGAGVAIFGLAAFLFLAWPDPARAQRTCRCLTTESLQVPARCTPENQGAKNTGTARGKCAGTDPKCPVDKECTVTDEVVCRGDHWEPTGEKRTDTCRDAVKQEEKEETKEEKEERQEAQEDKQEQKKHCGRVTFKNPPTITGKADVEEIARADFFFKAKQECREVCEKRSEYCAGEKKCQMAFIIADEAPAGGCSGGELTPRGRKPVLCPGTLRGCQCECR